MASITARADVDGRIISYRIRVSRGRGLKPYEMTWPERGDTIPRTWSKRTIEKEVGRVAASFEEECRKGNISTERKTFAEYAAYVIDLKERTGAKKRTVCRYRELLARLVDESCCGIGNIKLQDLRPDHLNKLYAKLAEPGQNRLTGKSLSAKTIIEHHRLVSTVLSQAVKEQLVPQNVAQRATPPKMPKHEADCFELEEIQAILEAIKTEKLEWQAVTHLLIATGARRGEVLGLEWRNVDFKTGKLYLCNTTLYDPKDGIYHDTPKTGESRYVTVAPAVLDILKAWRQEQTLERFRAGAEWIDTGYVFTQPNGREMHPDSVTNFFTKFSKRHGLPPIHPHKFRHTQASMPINAGVDIVSVSKRLGHAKVSTTTDIYSHVMAKADERASNVIDELLYQKQA